VGLNATRETQTENLNAKRQAVATPEKHRDRHPPTLTRSKYLNMIQHHG
jgi:hypothetical protein